MSTYGSATTPYPIAVHPVLSRACTALRQWWTQQLSLQQRLLDTQRPWEQEGPLRWKRELGGRRLVGSQLPDHASATELDQ